MAFVLFTRERIPIPVTALIVIASLALGLHLFPYERDGVVLGPQQIFSGFGHEALVAICCLMILGRALMVTGALEPLARLLARLWAFNRHVALLALLASAMVPERVHQRHPGRRGADAGRDRARDARRAIGRRAC